MNKQDRETLSRLQSAFREDAEKMTLPDSLSQENITALLQKEAQDKVVPISKARRSAKPYRKIITVAACFALVLVIAAVARNTAGRRNTGIRNAFEGFKIDQLIKKITSKEELDIAVSEIIEDSNARESASLSVQTSGDSSSNAKGASEAPIVVEKPEKGSLIVNDSTKEADIVKYSGGYLYVLTSAIDKETSAGTQVIKVIKTFGEKMQECASITPCTSGNVSVCDECIEMYVSGDRLAAIVSRKDFTASSSEHRARCSTVTLIYDISDPSSPSLISGTQQDGSYTFSEIANGEIRLVTTGPLSDSDSAPGVTAGSRRLTLSADKGEITLCENARENAYLLITSSGISGKDDSVSMLEILGCGANAEITACENGLYIARQMKALETGEKRTEIYYVSAASGKLSLAGTCSFDGGLAAPLNPRPDTGVCLVYDKDGGLYAEVLSADLKQTVCEADPGLPAGLDVTFIGSTAYVSDGETGKALIFTKDGITAEDAPAHPSGSEIYSMPGGAVLEIGSANSSGRTLINYYAGGETSSYTLEAGTEPLLSDSRALLTDSEGYFGIPVIISDSLHEESAYILFRVSGSSIEYAGRFVHESSYSGDAATRAVRAGDILYTVSGAKITAFSVQSGKQTESYIY